jgi:hypothetical protein
MSMNGISHNNFVVVAYVIGLGLLWGYAALLWIESRRNGRHRGGRP